MRYTFICQNCEIAEEVVMPMSSAKFDPRICPYCGGRSVHKITGAPALATSTFTHQPLDVTIGRDANARWADIRRRQELRNQVRANSGEVGLTTTSGKEFRPLTNEQKTLRTEASVQAELRGTPSYSESDSKLVR